jgi:hypothetical protein
VRIYEFDFKSFFNTVSMMGVEKALYRNFPQLKEVWDFVLTEMLMKVKYTWDELRDDDQELKVVDPKLLDRKEHRRLEVVIEQHPECAATSVIRDCWIERHQGVTISREGLPQGCGVSPILSTMALGLHTNTKLEPDLVMYADDGLLFTKDRGIEFDE